MKRKRQRRTKRSSDPIASGSDRSHLSPARAVPPETVLARQTALDGHRREVRCQVGPQHGYGQRAACLTSLQENRQALEGCRWRHLDAEW